MWQSVPDTAILTWDNAKTYCDNLTLAGYTDWRLPNITELKSIIDYSYFASNYWYESHFTLEAAYYWSSTTYAGSTADAHLVYFLIAGTNYGSKTSTYRAVCVR